MSLKIKKFSEIFNSLVTWITADNSKLSDFNIGSALRTLTEAFSLQIEEFYFNMKQNIEYAIETAIYKAFGFTAITSEYADGYITVKFIQPLESPIILPAGMMFSTSFTNSKVVYYKTTDDVSVEQGTTEIMVPVVCTEVGTVGNCEVGEINTLITGNSLIESVRNNYRFTSGIDAETKADMKARFQVYLKSLGRATKESIEYGAKTVDGVSGVYVDDKYIGFVNVYCHDKNGELPNELKSKITLTLEDYRAGGIEAKVLPVVRHSVNIENLVLVVPDNTEMTGTIESIKLLVTNFLNSYEVSQDFFVSDLVTLIMNYYKSIVITMNFDGLENIKILDNELVVAGKVNITYKYLSDWR